MFVFSHERGRKVNIYVGNLAYEVTESDIRNAFEEFGTVTSVKIITDNYSGKSKGFGFVEMEEADQAEQAIAALNGLEMKGRAITVNPARPKEDHRPSGGGMRRGGGGGNRGSRGPGGGGGRGSYGGGRGGDRRGY